MGCITNCRILDLRNLKDLANLFHAAHLPNLQDFATSFTRLDRVNVLFYHYDNLLYTQFYLSI